MKSFNIPEFYRSPVISAIKNIRKQADPRKKDFTPTYLDFGPVAFYIARHFGFCYGVENAIEISFRAVEENPGKNIFLLSQMIHNPEVNKDLEEAGVKFLQDTYGNQLIPFESLTKDDVVLIPAFGTTLEIEAQLKEKGIEIQTYNTTCPFVERVWKRAEQIGQNEYTIIIHGKNNHEETRATFSHSRSYSKAVVVKDMKEAELLAAYLRGEKSNEQFGVEFEGKYSDGFDITKDLMRVGVINQTTMLATETQAIADFFRNEMVKKYGEENIKNHFADTRDTLCYATNENQDATYGLLETDADLAIVVGGYNSSNTSHLVELLERKFKTYFISSEKELISLDEIHHFDYPNKQNLISQSYLPQKEKVKIIITSGASCPDAVVDRVLNTMLSFFPEAKSTEEVISQLN